MYILFDIGGTKTRIAGCRDGKTFEDVKIEKTTAENFEDGMELFEKLAREVARGEVIDGIAGGIAGPLNKEKTHLVNSPNIGGWVGKPLKKRLESAFNVPVFIENDSDIVGLGEAVYGAGRGFDIVAYITVSTGVGGGRIVEQKIDKSTYGFEPGHHIVEMRGKTCPGCSDGGSLESLISGTAIKKRTGKDAYKTPQDDPLWDELAQILAVGLNNVSVFWSPSVIVLGGSMIIGDPAIPIERTEEHFRKVMKIFPSTPAIKKAELKDEGGLYGALALLMNNE